MGVVGGLWLTGWLVNTCIGYRDPRYDPAGPHHWGILEIIVINGDVFVY